jgi:amidophosphoribosyltransferase
VDEIAKYVTADSLGYLSIEGLYAALGENRQGFCDACFTGDYILEFPLARPAAPLRLVGG